MANGHQVEGKYLFPSLLRRLAGPVDVNNLVQAFQKHPERIGADYQWASAIFEAILEFDPARLDDLIRLILEIERETRPMVSALSSLMIAARRKQAVIGPNTVKLFQTTPAEKKRQFLPFMLATRRRDALRPALQFIASQTESFEQQRRASPGSQPLAAHWKQRGRGRGPRVHSGCAAGRDAFRAIRLARPA